MNILDKKDLFSESRVLQTSLEQLAPSRVELPVVFFCYPADLLLELLRLTHIHTYIHSLEFIYSISNTVHIYIYTYVCIYRIFNHTYMCQHL